MQLVGQDRAHVADPLQGHRHPVEVALHGAADGEFDAAEDSLGGDRARIPRGGGVALQAGDEAGAAAGGGKVGGGDADILGGPITPAHGLDRVAEGLEQGGCLLSVAVADDHRLAAAQL